jgi:hypothetical protein
MKLTWFSDDWVIARELDSEVLNREREINLSAFWLIWLFWFELMMTVTSSRSTLLAKSSLMFLNLLFTSRNVWSVYRHILTNSCKSIALYRLAAGLSFEHVEQPDPIQSSGWTKNFVRRVGSGFSYCSTFKSDPRDCLKP